jgi:hypothetical protein
LLSKSGRTFSDFGIVNRNVLVEGVYKNSPFKNIVERYKN